MKKRILSLFLFALVVVAATAFLLKAPAKAANDPVPYVTDGTTTPQAVLDAWATGNYSYVKLGANLELTLTDGNIVVDLAGNDLTVNGSGTVNAFDSANDTYDHLLCGTLTLNGTVTSPQMYIAPNGNRYVALADGNRSTLHRLEMEIKTVSLRISSAGLYYKASYACDKLVEQKIVSYGIAVSLVDMPGPDFKTATGDAYTVADQKFVSGATVTSGAVVNILDADKTDAENLRRSKMALYANAYIDLGNGPIMADNVNVGKKAGLSASLYQVMQVLDEKYGAAPITTQEQLDGFYTTWKNTCGNMSLVNIGKAKVFDNSPLQFETGTTNAYCPACEKTVSWMGITQEYVDSLEVVTGVTDSVFMSQTAYETMHYYLAEDITNSDDPVMGFFRGPGGGLTACLHLNNHNLTTTKTTSIFGNSGVVNVMGNGVVTGYSPNKTEGAAVRNGNRNAKNGLNLYGGTYRKTADTDATSPVVCFDGAGRIVSIYDGVVIDGGNGKAIFADSSSARQKEGFLKLYNCTVNGDVVLGEIDVYATNVEIVGATINGTVTIPVEHKLSLAGKLDIDKLVLGENVRIATKGITAGSTINIDADGIFTQTTGSAAGYVDIFTPADTHKKITVKDNALKCSQDYTSNLVFEEGTTNAYCPVCAKTVTWTELTADAVVTLAANSHYYLAKDLTYTGSGDAFLNANAATVKSCIHLNGHNLTATKTRILYGGSSAQNIMGTGIVSGKQGGASGPGSTIQVNNKNNANQINLYGGTYRQQANAADAEFVINMQGAGGKLNIYDDAVIEANTTGKAIRIGNASSNHIRVGVYGGTVKGDVQMVGASSDFVAELTLDNAKVAGVVTADGKNTIKLSGAVQIDKLDIASESAVTLGELQDGAQITVVRPGVFSLENVSAAAYAKYFEAASINDKIIAKEDVLKYQTNYGLKVQLNSEGKAYCPVCQEFVTWTALSDDSSKIQLVGGNHYYLVKDLTFTTDNHGSGGSIISGAVNTTACVNLNGYNITSTASPALFVSSGRMNVMGNGIVSGYQKNANYGGAIHTNNKNPNNGISLYSGTYKKYQPNGNNAVIGMQGNGATVKIYEQAVIDGNGKLAINMGSNTTRDSKLYLYDATINGDIKMAGAGNATYVSSLEASNATILGTLNVAGTNEINFSGKTKITSMVVAAGSYVGFSNMQPGSAIKVSATGIFTTALDDAENWIKYFSIDADGEELLVRNNCLFQGVQAEVPVAEQADIDMLLTAYADKVVKYGDMHNHTDAGPTADGRFSLAQFKDRMKLLGMSFSTIVDHKQVAHMYHDDWIRESTDDTDIVFVGGSEPAGRVTDGGQGSFHYNMLINDPEVLLNIVKDTGKYTIREATYAGFNWGSTDYAADGSQNKNKTYDPTQYGKDPDGLLQTWNYPNFTVAEFKNLTANIYNAGGLLVHVHPKFSGYMDSNDPLDYFFGEDAGSKDAVASGLELHIPDNDNYMPSYEPNEKAYQTWVAILKAGKKCYGTYGNDNHRLPSADSITTIYASSKADSDEYMGYMHDGNFAPGWVGIRMQIGDASMGGTTDFAGQRVVFSIGDMYQNEHSDEYIYSTSGEALQATWDPSYNPDHEYIVQVYDNGGLLMQSVVDPGQMNYFAFDADDNAKYYRVVVWDMTQGYRCGVGNPIWNTVE